MKKFAFFLSSVFFAALLFVSTIYDLHISMAFVNQSSPFAVFMERFGEFPAIFLAMFCGSIIFWKTKAKVRVPLTIVSLMGCYYLVLMFEKYFLSFEIVPALKLFISALIVVLCIFGFKNVKKSEKLYEFCIFAFWSILICLIVICLLKFFGGRVRFRNMTEPFSEFSRWYHFDFRRGGSSFPSGHTANAFLMLTISFYYKNKLLFVILALWAFLMAVSRVIVGAHFVSDVLFGAAFSLLCMFFVYNYLQKRKK